MKNDIKQLNLMYLMLIRDAAIRQDFEMATRLGLSAENLDDISELPVHLLAKAAISEHLIFNMRVQIKTIQEALLQETPECISTEIATTAL